MPTGIDDLSIISVPRTDSYQKEEIYVNWFKKAEVDHAEIEHDLSIIMIVGEK